MAELSEMIVSVFDEEYDPENITARLAHSQKRHKYDFSEKKLGFKTDLAEYLFQVLE